MDKNNPLISVCVPVYKTEKLLKKCITSIMRCGLDISEYEVIVVDDGSDTKEILKILNEINLSYFDKVENSNIKLFSFKSNKGLLEARRAGVYASSGDYIFILDSDDFLSDNSLKYLKNTLKDHEGYDIIQSNFNEISTCSNKKKIKKPSEFDLISKKSLLEHLLKTKDIPGYLWSKLIKRSVYIKALNCISSSYMVFGEDFLQMVYISLFSKTYAYCPYEIYNYNRENDTNVTNIANTYITDKNFNKLYQYLSSANIMTQINYNQFKIDFGEEICNMLKKAAIKYADETFVTMKKKVDKSIYDKAKDEYILYFGKSLYDRFENKYNGKFS